MEPRRVVVVALMKLLRVNGILGADELLGTLYGCNTQEMNCDKKLHYLKANL